MKNIAGVFMFRYFHKVVSFHAFVLALLISISAYSQNLDSEYFKKNVEVYFSFNVNSTEEIRELTNVISIDNVEGLKVYAYANENEFNQFLTYNFSYTILPKPGIVENVSMSSTIDGVNDWNTYPTYDAYVALMNQFAADYPSICQLVDAGNSVMNRKILFVKISDNVNDKEAEPQFMYSSTMHGDETTGYVLMLRLIDSLLTSYGTDTEITDLINNSEIWINPLANPDGTYHGGNNTVNGAIRYNQNGYDLNRNFPDPENGVHPNQQPETTVMKNIIDSNNFILSANFHGGAEVVNYAWDTWSNVYPDFISHADEDWFQFISHEYADTVQTHAPSNYMSGFDDGITNGGAWYVIHGGRQDYLTYFRGGREVTIELSDIKLLPANQLPAHWEYNKRSFINYMQQTLYGISGFVTDTLGYPLHALITIENHDDEHTVIYSDSVNGFYNRMIMQGNYDITFSAPDHLSKTMTNVSVTNYSSTFLNVSLVPDPVPVELISFSANNIGSDVILNWQTATEINNSGFEMQRSQMSKVKSQTDWNVIGFVPGFGTSTELKSYSFVDKNLLAGTYQYRLKQIDFDGSFEYSNNIEAEINSPSIFSLEQNYPNPFNPSTIISWQLPVGGLVQLKIFNSLGEEIETLVDEFQEAGTHSKLYIVNSTLSSGVYYYQLRAGEYSSVKKLILMR